MRLLRPFVIFAAIAVMAAAQSPAQAQQKQPNMVVIWGDDIGFWNISAYSRGMMGYQTPNIDRIANEGAIFTDVYAQQSCTAGRAAFILGHTQFRTGLLTIGVPGSPQGITKDHPTHAELLKSPGYTSGHFGKNHLGERDEHLPTNHGFDEFFGNLYHLMTHSRLLLPMVGTPTRYCKPVYIEAAAMLSVGGPYELQASVCSRARSTLCS